MTAEMEAVKIWETFPSVAEVPYGVFVAYDPTQNAHTGKYVLYERRRKQKTVRVIGFCISGFFAANFALSAASYLKVPVSTRMSA